MSKGFWLMASHGRPDQAMRVARQMRDHGAEADIVIGLNDDDQMVEAYMQAWENNPVPNLQVMQIPDATCSADVYRYIYEIAERQKAEWLGITADDVWPETDNFEQELVKTLSEPYIEIVSANDNWQAPKRMHGAVVFDGGFLRDLGFLAPPGFKHMYVDDVWETVGRDLKNWKVRMDVVTDHRHPGKNAAEYDEHYKKNDQDLAAGRKVFEQWLKEHRSDLIQRLGEMRGIRTRKLDLGGSSVTIGIPSHDQKVYLETAVALAYTFPALIAHGVEHSLHVMPGDSLVARARNSIVGSWYRDEKTDYLLFVDSDMGWSPSDVLRLMMDAKVGDYDVVAAIGRRKTDTMESYCFLMEEDGRGAVDQETGCFEVRSVGSAFMLISRRIIAKLIEEFGEKTDYIHTDGKVYWALFEDQRRDSRQYWSEDYIFCERVRAVGGKVMANPHIALTHWGTKGWRGALAESGQLQTQLVEEPT